jgi:hypothetical protein
MNLAQLFILEMWTARQAIFDLRGFVGCIVVHHEVDNYATIEARGRTAIIPAKATAKRQSSTIAVTYTLRNRIKRHFAKLKCSGRLAIRCFKISANRLGFIHISAIRFSADQFVIDVLSRLPEDDATTDLLERAMAGEVFTAPLSGAIDGPALTAVPDADQASYALTRMEGQILLIPAADCTITHKPTWDETRRLFDVEVASTANAIVLANADEDHDAVLHAASRMLLALAADSLGGAEGVLALTLDYMKTRRQFDRPIAMFQSLKHRAANMRAALSMADALLWSSTSAADDMAQMGALRAHCTRVAKDVVEDCI